MPGIATSIVYRALPVRMSSVKGLGRLVPQALPATSDSMLHLPFSASVIER